MNKKTFTLLSSIVITALLMPTALLNAQISGVNNGTGTEQDPYQIGTYDELKAFWDHFKETTRGGTYAELIADIDASASNSPAAQGDTFHTMNSFDGNFNGQGYTISNLEFYSPANATSATLMDNKKGLFGGPASITISNVKFENVNATVGNRAAVLLGQSNGTVLIENVSLEGTFSCTDIAGAFVGRCQGGSVTIRNCKSKLSMSINSTADVDKNAGGIIGQSHGGSVTVENCVVDVTATTHLNGVLDVITGTTGSTLTVTNVYFNSDNCTYTNTAVTDAAAANGNGATGVANADWGTEASFPALDFNTIWTIDNGAPALAAPVSNVKQMYSVNAKVYISNNELFISGVEYMSNIMLIDMTGKVVLNATNVNTSVDISTIAQGIYIVKAQSENTNYTSKFIR